MKHFVTIAVIVGIVLFIVYTMKTEPFTYHWDRKQLQDLAKSESLTVNCQEESIGCPECSYNSHTLQTIIAGIAGLIVGSVIIYFLMKKK